MTIASRVVDAIAGRIDQGSLRLTRPDGSVMEFAGSRPGPEAEITVLDPQVERMLVRHGASALGEGYVEGWWDTPDLAAFLTMAAINQDASFSGPLGSAVKRSISSAWNAVKPDRRAGAVDTMAGHYNLGNDFYELWLDPSMTYSSGIFTHSDDLETAQRAKYAKIADLTGVGPGAQVLEIGCGWGGFAEVAARDGLRVRGLTLSTEQLAHARERLASAGLAGRAEFALQDYRDEHGRYDGIASIEMFEAVGEAYWPAYFDTVRSALAPRGRAVIQTITIADGLYERYRRSTDFIQQYVFPGGMLASPSVFEMHARKAGLRITRKLAFGQDYARTLALWREAFVARIEQVRALGFDRRFERIWEFYLAYCEAAFRHGNTDVYQFTLAHAADR